MLSGHHPRPPPPFHPTHRHFGIQFHDKVYGLLGKAAGTSRNSEEKQKEPSSSGTRDPGYREKPWWCFSLQPRQGPRAKTFLWPGFQHPLPKLCHNTPVGLWHSLCSAACLSGHQTRLTKHGVAPGAKVCRSAACSGSHAKPWQDAPRALERVLLVWHVAVTHSEPSLLDGRPVRDASCKGYGSCARCCRLLRCTAPSLLLLHQPEHGRTHHLSQGPRQENKTRRAVTMMGRS